MFDLATRALPNPTTAGMVAGVPFDLRLTPPAAAKSYPYTDLVNASGGPVPAATVLRTYAVALEDTLATAVILSLFTDRRASADDVLPRGSNDRRGWVGDEFMAAAEGAANPSPSGSMLWLLYVSKVTGDVLARARFAAQEALAWLVTAGIASRVDVTTEWAGANGDRLAVRPTIWQPDQVQPVYDVLWGTSIQRWAAV